MCLESLIGVAYSFYTLACAVIFPVAAAVAVFACLRRAGTVRKILGYFISMPVYVALCIFVLCEPQKSVLPLLSGTGLTVNQPELAGFLAAVTLGIVYLGIVSLICGAGMKKRGLKIMNAALTVVAAALCAFLTVMSHLLIPEAVNTAAPPTVGALFGYFGLEFSCGIGLDIVAAAVLPIYLVTYFVSFIGAGKAAVDDDGSVLHAAGGRFDPAIEPYCAICEHATFLKDSPGRMLCKRYGVVAEDHSCRRFEYDPLKRRPVRIPAIAADQLRDEEKTVK